MPKKTIFQLINNNELTIKIPKRELPIKKRKEQIALAVKDTLSRVIDIKSEEFLLV